MGTTEDEMVGWHHWLNGHEFEQAPRVGDGQGSLACCRPWGCKEWLNWTDTLLNWATELNWYVIKNKLIKKKITLAIWGPLWLHINCRIICSSSVKNVIGVLTEFALNMHVALHIMNILAILICSIHEHGISFQFFESPSVSFITVFNFQSIGPSSPCYVYCQVFYSFWCNFKPNCFLCDSSLLAFRKATCLSLLTTYPANLLNSFINSNRFFGGDFGVFSI